MIANARNLIEMTITKINVLLLIMYMEVAKEYEHFTYLLLTSFVT